MRAGSSASFNPSEIRLQAIMSRMRIMTGGISLYGCRRQLLNPADIRLPREQLPTGSPSPTKLKNVSMNIAEGISTIACVRSEPRMFGSISL